MKQLLPPLLFLFALLLRLALVAVTEFDGLYGQDAFAYFQYALSLRQALGAGELPPPFFWPLGYPALVALASLLTGPQPLAGQLISLLTGAAVAPLVYLIVLECHAYCVLRSPYKESPTQYGIRNTPQIPVGALIAGLLTAVAAQLTLYSLAAMSDAAGLFWATLSAWLLLRTFSHWQTSSYLPPRGQERQVSNPFFLLPSSFYLCALTLTLAIMTRWVYGLLVVPWGLAGLLAAREAGLSWQRIISAGSIALVIGLVGIGSQFSNSLGGELAHTGDLQVVGWHPANAFKSVVENADGFFDYGRATGLYYLRPIFHPAYIFPLFTPFMVLGLLALKNGPRSRAALLIGWPLTVYLFLAGIAWQNWRFPLALFAPLPVLVGLGLNWAWERLAGRGRLLLWAYCLVALAGSGLWAVRDVGNFTAWANQNRQIALEIGHQLPPQATLLAFGLTSTVDHYNDLDTRELFSLTERDLQEITRAEDPLFLLLDPDNVQRQWAGRSPGENYAWLQSHTRLTPIARYDDFVLYRVMP
ncbi:MAG: hypothetical protein R6X32_08040 [Chloroflexota bacterium]